MNKLLTALLAIALLPTPAIAQETAEDLVASMRIADMTYKELMTIMGRSISLMQDGVITQNRELIAQGANLIFTHPAPSHKPWAIMETKEDQADFKQALVAYDVVLDVYAKAVVDASKARNWTDAATSLSHLQSACVSCHLPWKDKAVKIVSAK